MLRKAEKRQAKIKLAIEGPSGSGKTYSALLLAYGMTGDWNKVAVIDTENGSADLYAGLGNYWVVPLAPPFSPDRYKQAIDSCIQGGIECIIIDSISHCWMHLLEVHDKTTNAMSSKNSYLAWSKVTPMHDAFIHNILQAPVHIISTMRSKQEYSMINDGNSTRVKKLGMKPIQRSEVEYEFTLVFSLETSHFASASKDRTGMFIDQVPEMITVETGKKIVKWANEGVDIIAVVKGEIAAAKTVDELNDVYFRNQSLYEQLKAEFAARKEEIEKA